MKTLSYGRQWINDDDITAIVNVLKGDWLTMGPTVKAFEEELAAYAGVKHAVTFSSGTSALHGAMYAAGLSQGDYSITTALTFVATSNSALYVGATPLFGDIDPNTLCLDPKEAERLAQSHAGHVKAIVPVSFAGYPLDSQVFREIADKNNAVFIEDASHSLGRSAPYDADMTTLSFHPVKHITTAEGGAVLTNSDEYARRLRTFRNHGTTRDEAEFIDVPDGVWHSEMQDLGYNYRLSEVHCALGLSQMKRLDSFVERRRHLANLYLEQLAGLEGVILPPHTDGHAWHLFVLQVKPELHKDLFMYLKENGINPQVHYRPVPLQPYYRKKFGYKAGDFPEAEKYYAQAMSLPLYPLMEDSDVLRVTDAIRKFLGR